MSLRKPPQPVQFELPALQNHHGVPLGNGNLGVLLWGGDGTLKLTLNRQDYWQHQGILRWKEGSEARAPIPPAWSGRRTTWGAHLPIDRKSVV